MARRRSVTLTDGEARLMNILWEKEQATVADVVAALPKRQAAAYNTVQTMMGILEQKGYVTHTQSGRAFVYRPLVDRGTVQRRALGHLVTALFGGSPSQLVLNVLSDERLDPAEVRRLKDLIDRA